VAGGLYWYFEKPGSGLAPIGDGQAVHSVKQGSMVHEYRVVDTFEPAIYVVFGAQKLSGGTTGDAVYLGAGPIENALEVWAIYPNAGKWDAAGTRELMNTCIHFNAFPAGSQQRAVVRELISRINGSSSYFCYELAGKTLEWSIRNSSTGDVRLNPGKTHFLLLEDIRPTNCRS
jgi:hypothetical protein